MSKQSRFNDNEALAQVMSRAAVDAEYRQRLLKEPRAALEEQLGALNKDVEIRFIEKGRDVDALIVLPDLVAAGHVATAPGPGADALAQVTHRATIDADYRQRLLTAPREAVQEQLGTTMKNDINIRFVEKDPGLQALIVLPDLVAEGDKLSVEELEAVAGGEDAGWCGGTCGCTLSCITAGATCKVTADDDNKDCENTLGCIGACATEGVSTETDESGEPEESGEESGEGGGDESAGDGGTGDGTY